MVSRLLYWFPRILTIVMILFMAMFSLDAFEGNETFIRKVFGFLINSIPVMIIIVILIIAWKREVAGGLLLIIASIAGMLYFHSFRGNPASLIILTPFFLAGALFILHANLYAKSGKSRN